MRVVFSDKAEKQFLRLDKAVQTQIKKYVLKLQELENTRERGKRLVGNFQGSGGTAWVTTEFFAGFRTMRWKFWSLMSATERMCTVNELTRHPHSLSK